MKIPLNGKSTLEKVFAEIEIGMLRDEFSNDQDAPERVPAKLKPLIAMPNLPEVFVTISQKAVS